MNTSENIDKLAAALSAAQGEFENIDKRKTAKVKGQTKDGRPFEYTYKYADIADVLAGVLPKLAKHELSIIQPTFVDSGVIFIRTRLMHSSGQWIESDYPVGPINGDHQKMGGALTYSRRYAICSILGVAAEEDTDGEGAAEQPVPKPKKAPEPGKLNEVESETVLGVMLGALEMCESPDSVRAWAAANRGAKASLLPVHQEEISRVYRLRLTEVSQPLAAE
jgi:hypothetical protein